MARSIGLPNGGSPFLARPIQFDAMRADDLIGLQAIAFSVLADFDPGLDR